MKAGNLSGNPNITSTKHRKGTSKTVQDSLIKIYPTCSANLPFSWQYEYDVLGGTSQPYSTLLALALNAFNLPWMSSLRDT